MRQIIFRSGLSRPLVLPAVAAATVALTALPAVAEIPAPSTNFYGVTGLIDMPSGEMQPDAQINTTISHFGGTTRTTLTFQISPRLSGSFRYASILHFDGGGTETRYDRSLDLRFLLHRETDLWPSLLIGIQDFAGTGVYSAEYLAATKHLTPRLKATLGLGWGRFGSFGGMGSPFGARPSGGTTTGTPDPGHWFRGPVAPFGGLEWQATDKLDFKLEYSSDAYTQEVSRGLLKRRSPINVGVEYQVNDSFRLGAYYLYGSKLGVSLQIALNPKVRPTGGMIGPAPLPVAPRPSQAADPKAYSTAWTVTPGYGPNVEAATAKLLAAEGMKLDALALGPHVAQIRIINDRYLSGPQAIGRAARVLSRTLPASIDTFQIVPVVHGMAASMVTIRRADLEQLEFAPDNAAALRARVGIASSGPLPAGALHGKGVAPRFAWTLGPYLKTSFFDPDNPARADFGLRLSASYHLTPGLILSGSVTKKIVGNLDQSTRVSNSTLPHVRSDATLYAKHGDPALERLQLAWYTHPARNIFTRVSAGYLESMFGGISGEVLWMPTDSRLALGAELNYVKQRDFNEGFGFQNYKVATGHLTAYYDFGGGYFGQVSVGRYLAGDWGTTVTFDRVFANGWRIGAFATKTNVSAAQFGEGSFDKGIRLQIPISWVLGTPSRTAPLAVIRPLTRDGGAQLDLTGRLYESLREYQRNALDQDWGRVWR